MFDDTVCWHNGGQCKNPSTVIFIDKKRREISVCPAHSGPYHRSDEFEVSRVRVPL